MPGDGALPGSRISDVGEEKQPEQHAADEGGARRFIGRRGPGSSEAGAVSAVASDRTAQSRRSRRKAAEGGTSAFNGVDTAAVR
jgi:hypothetical protein